MSTLVAYDSSSEEESFSTRPNTSDDNGDIAKGVQIDLEPLHVEQLEDRPMVGPSIPSEAIRGYEEMDENDGESLKADPPTSERDMIRYLTQATHPMTEIPPSPPGSPNPSSGAKFKHFLSLKAKGVHFNEDLAGKSAFRNPSLLATLLERAGIDSADVHRTSLPTHVFDPTSLPELGFKEALLKSQQHIRERLELERKALAAAGKRTVEFTSGGKSATSSATSSPGGLLKRQKH